MIMKRTEKMHLINNVKAVIAFLVGLHLVVSYLTKALPFGLELSLVNHPIIWTLWAYIGLPVALIVFAYGLCKLIGMERLERIIDKMM